jgi:hypothetical protein
VTRQVFATAVRETWSQHDPELAERDVMAKEKRRELKHPVLKSTSDRAAKAATLPHSGE